MIGNVETIKQWRKTYQVEAVRLTSDNMKTLADFLGADYYPFQEPHIGYRRDEGYEGEWLVKKDEKYFFMAHDAFLENYHTHSERMARDEKYARVFQLVISAMKMQASATYHQDDTGEMDIVAISTTNAILGAL
jgi:hypothetical protein